MSAPRPGYRYSTFIWPGILILIGVFALLVNTNLIPTDRLYRLFDLWPLLLVVIGLELLVRRMPLPTATVTVATVLILVLAAVGVVAYVAAGPSAGSGSLDSAQSVDGVSEATLEVDVGGATITITGDQSLGGDLYRAHIKYSGRTPSVEFNRSSGLLRIAQNTGGFVPPSEHFALDLRIATAIPWSVTINAAGIDAKMNLADVKVKAMTLNTAGASDDITLGSPNGSVPIKMNGGGLTVHIHRPDGAAISVRVSCAAASLTLDGQHEAGIGTVEASSGSGTDRYAVDVSGAGCTVSVDSSSPSG
jgi:hypothetical protein